MQDKTRKKLDKVKALIASGLKAQEACDKAALNYNYFCALRRLETGAKRTYKKPALRTLGMRRRYRRRQAIQQLSVDLKQSSTSEDLITGIQQSLSLSNSLLKLLKDQTNANI